VRARGRKGKAAREEVGVGLIVEHNKWKAELSALVYTASLLLSVDCGLRRAVLVIWIVSFFFHFFFPFY
jgi:hypothetical protein